MTASIHLITADAITDSRIASVLLSLLFIGCFREKQAISLFNISWLCLRKNE